MRARNNAENVSERAAHPSGLFLKQERVVISLHREIEDLCSVQAENEDEIKKTHKVQRPDSWNGCFFKTK